MNTIVKTNPKKTNWVYKYKIILDLISKTATLTTLIFAFYGSMLLFSFSRKYNINFIDLITSNILISIGCLAIFMIVIISIFMITILYINNITSNNSFLCFTYITPYKSIRKHKIKSMILFNLLICLWPFVLIKSESANAVFIYTILTASTILILSTIKPPFTSMRREIKSSSKKIGVLSLKRAKLIAKNLLFITLPAIDIILLFLLITYLSIIFKQELILINDLTFASVIFVFHFFLKLPSLPTSKKKRNLANQLMAFVIIANTIMLLSFSFSKNLAQAVSVMIGITSNNICFLRKEVTKYGIPKIYIDEKRSDNDIVKLNLITKVNDIYYLSKSPDNQTERKANIRIKGLNLTELDCPTGRK